jgi:hypothetical protein
MADDLWEELTTLESSLEEDLEEEEFTTEGLIDIPAILQDTEQSVTAPLLTRETVVETQVPPEPEPPEPVPYTQ